MALPNRAIQVNVPETQAPQRPALRAVPPLERATATSAPGGFWIRGAALLIDGLIVTILTFPIRAVLQLGLAGMKHSSDVSAGRLATLAVLYIGLMVCQFLYFAWFYKNKGGTPGKLIFGLRVINIHTGANLSYNQTFKRQYVGMFADAMTLYIGLMMAGFRKDKRAVHDFVGGTQVIRVQRS